MRVTADELFRVVPKNHAATVIDESDELYTRDEADAICAMRNAQDQIAWIVQSLPDAVRKYGDDQASEALVEG